MKEDITKKIEQMTIIAQRAMVALRHYCGAEYSLSLFGYRADVKVGPKPDNVRPWGEFPLWLEEEYLGFDGETRYLGTPHGKSATVCEDGSGYIIEIVRSAEASDADYEAQASWYGYSSVEEAKFFDRGEFGGEKVGIFFVPEEELKQFLYSSVPHCWE